MNEMVKANKNDLLAILTQNYEHYLKGREIVSLLASQGISTSTRDIAEMSKELRADGYRVVSDKSCNGGYILTDDRDKITHFERMQNGIIESLKLEQQVTWEIINKLDKETRETI